MVAMHSWAKLDIGSHQRTRWQRFKVWLFGKPEQVHLTTEIAHGVAADVIETDAEDRVAARAR
jgi:hypothetical protein